MAKGLDFMVKKVVPSQEIACFLRYSVTGIQQSVHSLPIMPIFCG